MSLRNRLASALPSTLLFATIASCSSAVSFAQNSGVNLALHANSQVTAATIGLPPYPGATLHKDADNDSAADLGLTFGSFHFTMKAVSYVTTDPPSQVIAFYRKTLSRYGEVLKCNHGKPVGTLTVTHTGLTCTDQSGGGKVKVDDSSSGDHELRAGSPHLYRIMGIDEAHQGSTHFGLVYLELPKDSDTDAKSK